MDNYTVTEKINFRSKAKKQAKHRLRIDMTPMVDLGFLLITFFVITTEMIKPTYMDIAMPKDVGSDMEIGKSYVITVIPNVKEIYYYEGDWNEAKKESRIKAITIPGLRQVISNKKDQLSDLEKYKEGPEGLMLLIKPTARADYKTVVDLLDETTINRVGKYALVKISKEENDWIRQP